MDLLAWRYGLWLLLLTSGALFLSSVQVWGVDFGPVWAAVREGPSLAYDLAHITRSQPWIMGDPANPTTRPFVYPPPSLLLFQPFGHLPYWIANGLWTLGIATVFICALRVHRAPLWCLLFTPAIVAVAAGQATLLVGALVLFGLRHRRGVLLGIAACLKPPLLLLLPVGLAARRQWAVMAETALTGLALSATTIILWGIGPWLDWSAALAQFHELVLDPRIVRALVTPYGALEAAGLDGRLAWLALPLATFLVWRAFRCDNEIHKLAALTGGALLIGPYGLSYELALMAPAVAVAFDQGRRDTIVSGYVFAVGFWVSGLVALFAALAAVLLAAPRRHQPDD